MKNRNKYQEKFNQKKAPIDKEQLWSQIAADKDFPKKDKGFRGGLYLASLLLIALLGICLWQITDNKKAIDQLDKKVSSVEIITPTEIPITSTDIAINKSNNREGIDKNNDLEQLAESNKNKTQNNTLDSSDQTASSINKPLKENNTAAAVKSTISTQSSYGSPSDTDISLNTTIVESRQKTNTTQTIQSVNKESIETKETKNISLLKPETKKNNTQINENITSPEILPIDLDLLFLDFRSPPDINGSISLSPKPKKHNWIIGLMGGTGIASHSLASLSDDDYITKTRIENVQNINSQYASLSLQRLLAKNFSISAEAELENLYQRYDYSKSEMSLTRNEDPSEGFYSYTTLRTDYEKYHSYQFINLNLLAQKRIQLGAIGISIGAGVLYNLSFNLDGSVFDQSENDYNLSTVKEYKSNTGLSYLGNIGVNLNLTDRITLNCDLRYKSSSVLTDPNLFLDHKVSSWKLGLGLSYRI